MILVIRITVDTIDSVDIQILSTIVRRKSSISKVHEGVVAEQRWTRRKYHIKVKGHIPLIFLFSSVIRTALSAIFSDWLEANLKYKAINSAF